LEINQKEVLDMYTAEIPQTITGTKKISVTTSQAVDLAGKSAILKNLGSDTVYIGYNNPATADDFPVAMGESLAPLTGKFYILSAGTSDVRLLYSDPFGI
jgi:hypothetical protein